MALKKISGSKDISASQKNFDTNYTDQNISTSVGKDDYGDYEFWCGKQDHEDRVDTIMRERQYRSNEEIRLHHERDWGTKKTNDAFADVDRRSSCYIATASLQGKILSEDLQPLKNWRYTVLESNSIGKHLSNYYRRTAPGIAAKISAMPLFSTMLRNMFVRPALSIVKKKRNFVRDFSLWVIFIVMMVFAHAGTVLKK